MYWIVLFQCFKAKEYFGDIAIYEDSKDIDFKVAANGIKSLQMDSKLFGISPKILSVVLE